MSRDRLLIVGASGRAAAGSAIRAGFEPTVLDLFADADTERLCDVRKLPMADYPHGFVELARAVPPMPWMYTGGLENHPDVVAAISETRVLWGNPPAVLKAVRDPLELHDLLSAKGLERPRTSRGAADASVRWLRKPLKSAAGFSIRFATPDDLKSPDPNFYLQEFIPGPAMSLVAVSPIPSAAHVGVTRQLVGEPWLHARPFQYAGNVVGFAGHDAVRRAAFPNAEAVRNHTRITGVWGLDFIWKDDRPFPIEVNPRYPASGELFEYASGTRILTGESRFAADRAVGKAIYYAPRRLTFPASGPWDESLRACTDVWRRPDFADLPHADDEIAAGHPVCTVFAEGQAEEACVAALKARAAELDRLFAG